MGKYVYSMPNGKYVPNHSNDAVYEIKFGRVARLICCFMCIVIFLCFAWLYVLHNLWSNSVYYAKHTSNTKVAAPEIIMLLDNLEYMHRPKELGLSYEFDGTKIIYNCNLSGADRCVYTYLTDRDRVVFGGNENITYTINTKHDIVHMTGSPYKTISNTDSSLIAEQMRKSIEPVLEANQKEPSLNLQWIFDWYYHDRFN